MVSENDIGLARPPTQRRSWYSRALPFQLARRRRVLSAAERMFAEMTDESHLVQARLAAPRLYFLGPLGLLFGGQLQGLEVLEGVRQIELGDGVFPLHLLEGGA